MIMNARISEEAKKMETESGKHADRGTNTVLFFFSTGRFQKSTSSHEERTYDRFLAERAKNSSGLS